MGRLNALTANVKLAHKLGRDENFKLILLHSQWLRRKYSMILTPLETARLKQLSGFQNPACFI